jgi:hypothetical protein
MKIIVDFVLVLSKEEQKKTPGHSGNAPGATIIKIIQKRRCMALFFLADLFFSVNILYIFNGC